MFQAASEHRQVNMCELLLGNTSDLKYFGEKKLQCCGHLWLSYLDITAYPSEWQSLISTLGSFTLSEARGGASPNPELIKTPTHSMTYGMSVGPVSNRK